MPALQHIDEDRLYHDLAYRFEYLAKFADFGDEDIKAIHASAPVVAPLVPAIVDAVYEKLFSFDCTKRIFMQRNENYQGDLPKNLDDLNVQHEQIRFRKGFLGKYLEKLVTAKYDANFIKYLDYVGKIHTSQPGKKSKINVEYVHCSALFTYVSSFVVNAIMQAGLPKDVERKTVLAFNKLLWIQNDFFAKWYVKDTDKHEHGLKGLAASSHPVETLGWISAGAAVGAVVAHFLLKQ